MHTPFMDKLSRRRAGAGGRLKQRLTQLLVRSSCTTNTTKTNTTTSATAFVSLDKANANPNPEHSPRHSPDFCVPCTHHHHHQSPKLEGRSSRRSRRRRRASVVHVSIECTGGASASSGRRSVRSDAPLLQSSSWPTNDAEKQSRSRGKSRRSPSASRRQYCSSCSSFRRARARVRVPPRCSFSSSAVTTDDELAPFSGEDESGEEEEAETRTLFSSLSFSSDSTSEFYHTNSSSTGISRKSRDKNARRRRAPRRALVPEASRQGVPGAAKHQMCYCRGEKDDEEGNAIKKMSADEEAGDGLGHGGQAVVKRSSNPYADFRSSMVEMVVERRIASVGKMEELLVSYLSLNSSEHHPSILDAFEDVWVAVFGEP